MLALLSRQGVKKVENQIPYLTKEDFLESLPVEGTLLEFSNGAKTIAYGYSGKGHRYDACITDEPLSSKYILDKLEIAYKKRLQAFGILPQAYRLVHNEADQLPGLTIEIFQAFAVITYFNKGLIAHTQILIDSLNKLLRLQGIYTKDRTPNPTAQHTQLVFGISAPEELVIEETTGLYTVRLMAGLMTGLFLDQRANRIWLQKHAVGKRVCNSFSYTGSLSIACGVGNAKSTKSIDLSRTYTDWCRHNLDINQLSAPTHEAISSDTFAHFAYCQRKGITYDLIILDPPTFAKNKSGTFSVPENYGQLVREASKVLAPRGTLVCCTNYSQWSLSQFQKEVQKNFPLSHRIIHQGNADRDFPQHPHWPESEHLKYLALELVN